MPGNELMSIYDLKCSNKAGLEHTAIVMTDRSA